MMAERSGRRIKWTVRPFIAYVAEVGLVILGSIVSRPCCIPRGVGAHTAGGIDLSRVYIGEPTAAAISRAFERSGRSAFARSRVGMGGQVEAGAGPLDRRCALPRPRLRDVPGSRPPPVVIGAAVFMIPAFLCALIIDIGGAFGVPDRS